MTLYATPLAFKHAVEQRLKNTSAHAADFARRRQLLVFDRFLARVMQHFGDAMILKGGLVLELRLNRARTTKDVDLHMLGDSSELLSNLQEAGRTALADHMRFEVQPDPTHPSIEGDGMKYDGYRFKASCMLAGKIYGQRFGVDVAYGDPTACSPDEIVTNDLLGFAGITPPTLRVYPVITHIAEKLHAYTLPRKHPNSRVKDLPDIALLASVGKLDGKLLRQALEQTFSFRGTHPIPETLPSPPVFWSKPYQAMAEADQIPWKTISEVLRSVAHFITPVLSAGHSGTWTPQDWSWRP